MVIESCSGCMSYDHRKVGGAVLFVAGSQFVLGMLVAEALYPGYSISQNLISNLGAGPSAWIFNSSVFLLGLMVVISAYFVHRFFHRLAIGLLLLTGAGAMGVGVFPKYYAVHVIAFISSALLPIATYRFWRTPFSYLSVAMAVLSLSAMALFSAQYSLGEQYFLGLLDGVRQ
jgi:hypothetical membrane protein